MSWHLQLIRAHAYTEVVCRYNRKLLQRHIHHSGVYDSHRESSIRIVEVNQIGFQGLEWNDVNLSSRVKMVHWVCWVCRHGYKARSCRAGVSLTTSPQVMVYNKMGKNSDCNRGGEYLQYLELTYNIGNWHNIMFLCCKSIRCVSGNSFMFCELTLSCSSS